MEFKVKRDFLSIFLLNALLILVATCLVIFFSQTVAYFLVFFIFALAILALYDSSVIFAYCRVNEKTLVFQTGLFKYVINLNEITSVSKSKNYHNSLSLSNDRVRIVTIDKDNKQKVFYVSVTDNDKLIELISPKKQEILNVVKTSAPAEKIKEDKKESKPKQAKTNVKKNAKSVAAKKSTSKTTSKSATKSTSNKNKTAKKETK